jgi:hypothetical protein
MYALQAEGGSACLCEGAVVGRRGKEFDVGVQVVPPLPAAACSAPSEDCEAQLQSQLQKPNAEYAAARRDGINSPLKSRTWRRRWPSRARPAPAPLCLQRATA